MLILHLSLLQINTGVQWEASGTVKAILAAAGVIFVLSGASAVRSDSSKASPENVPAISAYPDAVTR
jgi:hypothetical protein